MKTMRDVSTGLIMLSCEEIPTKPQHTNAGNTTPMFLVTQ